MILIGWIIIIVIIGFFSSLILTPIISEMGVGTIITILLLFEILNEMEKNNQLKQDEISDKEDIENDYLEE